VGMGVFRADGFDDHETGRLVAAEQPLAENLELVPQRGDLARGFRELRPEPAVIPRENFQAIAAPTAKQEEMARQGSRSKRPRTSAARPSIDRRRSVAPVAR
jgi:hypothetical protein